MAKEDDKISQNMDNLDRALSNSPSLGKRVKAFLVLAAIFGVPIAGAYYIISMYF